MFLVKARSRKVNGYSAWVVCKSHLMLNWTRSISFFNFLIFFFRQSDAHPQRVFSCIQSCGIVTGITAHNQFIHLHGQRGARLDHDQSVYGSIIYPCTLLLTIVSPFFFWAPENYLQALEKICVDHLVYLDGWIKFNDKLKVKSQKFLLIVILFRIRIQCRCAYCQL